MLPRLRAAMEQLHRRHRDAIASRVAERYGLRDAESLQQLELPAAAAARVAHLDQQVAKIIREWFAE